VNAFHTTVPCISGITHKVLGVKTLSRFEHSTAQTREVVATMEVIEDVISRGECTTCVYSILVHATPHYTLHVYFITEGFPIQEVAHDSNVALTKKITERGLINSYDTWHGTCFGFVFECTYYYLDPLCFRD
jgi:hypothetical protein